ncbi:MAG TPA: biotin transporter BioY [Candidatus Omnitrophica bacterium]|nr:biotin transporter BioY [Candidatus Omnitrophota bacterium]
MAIVENYLKARYSFFRWRYSLAFVNKIALASGMACLTGLAAQVKVSLPWTPVPITGQTFAVLLSGVLLGRYYGGISQAIYVAIGVAGLPWFAGWSGGYTTLIGPTGGYIVGFILAALYLGHFTDRYIRARSFFPMFGLMLFANFILIHIPGLLQLGLWFYLLKGTLPTLRGLLLMGSIPFIIGDVTKIVAAATLAKIITPKEAFNGEVDIEKAKRWRIF